MSLCAFRFCQILYMYMLQDSSRIQNAFELHRIIEQQQGWVPNLKHYSRLPGYLTPENPNVIVNLFLTF